MYFRVFLHPQQHHTHRTAILTQGAAAPQHSWEATPSSSLPQDHPLLRPTPTHSPFPTSHALPGPTPKQRTEGQEEKGAKSKKRKEKKEE